MLQPTQQLQEPADYLVSNNTAGKSRLGTHGLTGQARPRAQHPMDSSYALHLPAPSCRQAYQPGDKKGVASCTVSRIRALPVINTAQAIQEAAAALAQGNGLRIWLRITGFRVWACASGQCRGGAECGNPRDQPATRVLVGTIWYTSPLAGNKREAQAVLAQLPKNTERPPVRPTMPIFSPACIRKEMPLRTGSRSGLYRTCRHACALLLCRL